jgi:DNA-binding FadR family transcriptional regulator
MAVKESTQEDREILKRAYEAIIKELGFTGFWRFVEITYGKKGNWVEERKKILKELNTMDVEELIEYIKKHAEKPKEEQIVI